MNTLPIGASGKIVLEPVPGTDGAVELPPELKKKRPYTVLFCRQCRKLQPAFTRSQLWAYYIGGFGSTQLCSVCGWYPRRKQIKPHERKAIHESDSYQCVYCGKSPEKLHLDHVVPVQFGGTEDASNLVSCCQQCNNKRNGGHVEPQFGRFTSRQP